ncbi:hypothetical protein C5167_014712 [Papaver somniferum]|uniref:Uncharacterized protein n=1 Tax=Papaver somniferum TaxID=3469 RepID=A0A4Y7J812_PAPSO|nr:uncharacterized protein LOC113361769 [Papaver somniferum]RZC55859.1 hypothetical protein C5167_014712 [Papaver somniferum]
MRSSRVVADFSLMRLSSPVLHREECSCKHSNLLLGTEAVGVKEVSLTIEGGEVQDRQEAAAAACECLSSRDGCYVDDQCHLPGCWTNRNQDHIFGMVLSVISFLLTFSAVGGFIFTQVLTTVGRHDQILKHSLVAFNMLFAASFGCNFLAAFILFMLQSRREYIPYKNFSLIISNTASFAFLILGYGFVIAFNIQHR